MQLPKLLLLLSLTAALFARAEDAATKQLDEADMEDINDEVGRDLSPERIAELKAEEEAELATRRQGEEPYVATPEMLAQHEGQPLTADDEPVVEAHKYDWAHIDQDEDKKHTVAELRKWHLKEFEEKKPELSKAEREKRVDELVEFLLTKDSDGDGLLTHEEVTGKKHHTEL